jgi:hypothetical protein
MHDALQRRTWQQHDCRLHMSVNIITFAATTTATNITLPLRLSVVLLFIPFLCFVLFRFLLIFLLFGLLFDLLFLIINRIICCDVATIIRKLICQNIVLSISPDLADVDGTNDCVSAGTGAPIFPAIFPVGPMVVSFILCACSETCETASAS